MSEDQSERKPEINSETTPTKKGIDKFKILSAILLLVIIFLLIQMNGQRSQIRIEVNKQAEIDMERQMVEKELEDMLDKYEAMSTNNDSLNAQLSDEREKIEIMLKDLRSNRNDKALTLKYKSEAETLRKIMKGYVMTIDSLNTMNQNLTAQNKWVKKVLDEERTVTKKLTANKGVLEKKVKMASLLKSFNQSVTPIKFRFGNVESKTTRAKRVDKIQICFTLAENIVAEKGNRNLYVRITTPGGQVLAKGTGEEYMFDFPEGRGYYSIKDELNYQGDELEKCIFWYKQEEMESGDYTVALFSDGGEIGRMTFSLE